MSIINTFSSLLTYNLEFEALPSTTRKELFVFNNNAEPKQLYSTNDQPDGLIVGLGSKIDKQMIDKLTNLKYIGMLGTGYGGIDIDYARRKSIVVTNISNYSSSAVAEFCLAVTLEKLRDISLSLQQARTGNLSDNFLGQEIKGKNVGIVGLGNIGYQTAQLFNALGANTYYWSRNRKLDKEKGLKFLSLNELVAKCDILSINLTLNSGTNSILNNKLLSNIKPGALVINLSPMELFNFNDLIKSLINKRFELIIDHADEISSEQLQKLCKIDNVTIYPPIAYLTEEANKVKYQILIENIRTFLAGQPINQVN